MESHLSALLAFFAAHPHSALAAIFLAALVEALAVVGTVLPGSTIVFLGGVLIGLDVLDPWRATAAAVAGAVVGDGISYWLGQHYRDRLGDLWPFRKFPRLLPQGQAYFSQHGGKSVFLGRFIGALRAIVPVVAGMSAMPPPRFFLVNVLSALAWAATHLIPGYVFGASLQLAGAVSARLVFLLLLLAAFLWGITRLVRIAFRYGWPYVLALRARVLGHARHGSGAAARITRLLFDPASANEPVLLIAALLLIGGVGTFFGILEDVVVRDPLLQLDQSIYAALQALRTAWGDALMVGVTTFGAAAVILPVVIVVALFLAWQRDWRSFGYWLGAAAVAELTVTALKSMLTRPRPYNPLYAGLDQFSFPSGHTMMSLAVYGFLAFLLARGRSSAIKAMLALAVACVVLLIAFSRLYLGAHWFSDVLASLSLGLAWLMLLCLAHARRPRHARWRGLPLALLALVTVAGTASWHIASYQSAEIARYSQPPPSQTVLANWQTDGWRLLPAARSELDGEPEEPFSVQWAGSRAQLSTALAAAGWEASPSWSLPATLLWLLPATPIQQLPVLPKFDHGAVAKATFVKAINPRQRAVLRLWRLPYAIPGAAGSPPRALWLGTATIERLHHPPGLVSLVRTAADFETVPGMLKQELQDQGWSAVRRQGRRGNVLLIW